MAIQPVSTDYNFHGYNVPVPMFIDGSGNDSRVTGLAPMKTLLVLPLQR